MLVSCQSSLHSHCQHTPTAINLLFTSGRNHWDSHSGGFQRKPSKAELMAFLSSPFCLQLSSTCPCSPVQQRCWVSARQPTRHPAPFPSASTSSPDGRPTTRPPVDRSSPRSIKFQVSRVSASVNRNSKSPNSCESQTPQRRALSPLMYRRL